MALELPQSSPADSVSGPTFPRRVSLCEWGGDFSAHSVDETRVSVTARVSLRRR